VEGFHNAFHTLMAATHPSIWGFIEALRVNQRKQEVLLQQYRSGITAPPPKKVYRDRSLRLKKVAENYGNLETISYLNI